MKTKKNITYSDLIEALTVFTNIGWVKCEIKDHFSHEITRFSHEIPSETLKEIREKNGIDESKDTFN